MSMKKIILKSSDGKIFEIEEGVALQSQVIAHMMEDNCVENRIPLTNITSDILSKVIKYCKKHVVIVSNGDGGSTEAELKEWDAKFVNDIDQSTLFHLIMAADFLNIKTLLNLTFQTVADMISGKTSEEIRAFLNIENDFTPEEEANMRQENSWTFN
ncbi:unnamed protein product [Microthlaspi erraticum]|uniref:SKP1-like protein n=1 Tax=Microthlaspi erraticum TaxID=1685480 RepID=A0A6D2K4G4_9BRAS|nr:unnamed protein product [Microthlaspi erraticum]